MSPTGAQRRLMTCASISGLLCVLAGKDIKEGNRHGREDGVIQAAAKIERNERTYFSGGEADLEEKRI